MNKDKRLLLICIVVILGLIGCNIYLQYENDKLTKEKDNVKVDITGNLKIEESENNYNINEDYGFVPSGFHWTSLDEQKIKVDEIEKKIK